MNATIMSTNEQSRLARSAKLPKEAGRLKALADWFNGALLPVIPSKAIHGATPVTTDELLEDMQREKEATEEDVVPLLLYPQAWAQPAYRDKPLLTTTQAIDSQMVCRWLRHRHQSRCCTGRGREWRHMPELKC
ncbi:hypothetical protein PG996_010641 [Apiospora saccharicola]|uniref:Uncharacterized protein n=1 Tax=Apiospora saccharicola TaxID=335842 RepID=A0ABR1URK9_9PEZI